MIEDFDERTEALRRAYALTKKVLAVAAMLESQAAQPGRPYRDGFVTSRNTFQKYYSQAQLAAFIADVLDEEPIPVSPGVFFIFRDKDLEQSFLSGRQRNITLLQRLERPESHHASGSHVPIASRKYTAGVIGFVSFIAKSSVSTAALSSNKLPSSFRVLSALIVVAERSDGGKLRVTCPSWRDVDRLI